MSNSIQPLILLNGEPRTQRIETIDRLNTSLYRVRFKNSSKAYKYSANKVVLLTDGVGLNPDLINVYRDDVLQKDVVNAWQFSHRGTRFWRLMYASGFVGEYTGEQVRVVTSCLDDKQAANVFAYLREVAATNPLGTDNGERGILSKQYERVGIVDKETVAACFLNPSKNKMKSSKHHDLICPFGCNASQKRALDKAFENQVSVIQGPPGTGKTQTILNIVSNIVYEGKTVLVVSNNNSAISNVQEKLHNYGFDFIVAPLGRKDNKQLFIENQSPLPEELNSWHMDSSEEQALRLELHRVQADLDKVYALKELQATLKQKLQTLELEWKHFCLAHHAEPPSLFPKRGKAVRFLKLWLRVQAMAEDRRLMSRGFFPRIFAKLVWLWWRKMLHIANNFDENNLTPLINELQTRYYHVRMSELKSRLETTEKALQRLNADQLEHILTEKSALLFKAKLHNAYANKTRKHFESIEQVQRESKTFAQTYPVVLSTTFSARTCVFAETPYDYLIVDEASQVAVETGFLALTCAKHAIVVGDTMQLPNIVTSEARLQLNAIMAQYGILEAYDCAKYSFLKSLVKVINDVPQTLLREHYRCHPRIINFCNQKFYGGNLLVMTQENGSDEPLMAIKTPKGNHAVDNFNQREIDVICKEVLPKITSYNSVGVIAPYNKQVDALKHQLPNLEVATVHKFQGREKDAIIMSVVDNQITPFVDDPNLLNVAVSRAKKKLCIVITGNEQSAQGNLSDLIGYINYNNCTVSESRIASIFDYLYGQYTSQRQDFLKKHRKVSEYESENLTYALLSDVLAEMELHKFEVLCHVPVRQIIRDTSLMSENERTYISNYATHVDFLVVNKLTKMPVMAVETDGYAFHNEKTVQHLRDEMKNHVFEVYGIPLLRLSTKGSSERERVINMLMRVK